MKIKPHTYSHTSVFENSRSFIIITNGRKQFQSQLIWLCQFDVFFLASLNHEYKNQPTLGKAFLKSTQYITSIWCKRISNLVFFGFDKCELYMVGQAILPERRPILSFLSHTSDANATTPSFIVKRRQINYLREIQLPFNPSPSIFPSMINTLRTTRFAPISIKRDNV